MTEQKTFHLTIARVDGPVFDADAVSVMVPGKEGDMTIMANHEPLISPLKAGTITIRQTDNETESIETTGGTLEVSSNHVSILI